ncbi:hypothetical protein D5Q56_20200 [Vibrio parahaemolyticus]|nr:hypothetical protein [Vibrio parahaemolyticus]
MRRYRAEVIMEHVVKIIEALAWPVTVLIAVFALRKPLIALLPQLKVLKYKELEVEFEKELETLSLKAHVSKAKLNVEATVDDEETDFYLQQVKELSPRAAIMEAWLGLESNAIATAQHFGLAPKNKRLTFASTLKALTSGEVLTPEDASNINELRMLRNKAVHDLQFSVSDTEAAKFMEIARDQTDVIVGQAWQKYGGCSG